MLAALIMFAVSLLGVSALFALKYWEAAHQTVLVPAFRTAADGKAIQLKEFLEYCRATSDQIPPTLVKVLRLVIHDLALGFARSARAAEVQAHRLADFVSHKHRFERRETRSQFLKDVSDFKNGHS